MERGRTGETQNLQFHNLTKSSAAYASLSRSDQPGFLFLRELVLYSNVCAARCVNYQCDHLVVALEAITCHLDLEQGRRTKQEAVMDYVQCVATCERECKELTVS